MGKQIIKQPNGKYCIFDSIVDDITQFDCTKDEILDLWVEEYRIKTKIIISEVITKINREEKPYFNFTKSYEEAIECISKVHGEEEAENMRKLIEIKK